MVQEHATLYEKLVFDVISYLMSGDRDDEVSVELHSKVSNFAEPLNNRKMFGIHPYGLFLSSI